MGYRRRQNRSRTRQKLQKPAVTIHPPHVCILSSAPSQPYPSAGELVSSVASHLHKIVAGLRSICARRIVTTGPVGSIFFSLRSCCWGSGGSGFSWFWLFGFGFLSRGCSCRLGGFGFFRLRLSWRRSFGLWLFSLGLGGFGRDWSRLQRCCLCHRVSKSRAALIRTWVANLDCLYQ